MMLNGGSYNGQRLLGRHTVTLMTVTSRWSCIFNQDKDKFGLGFSVTTAASSAKLGMSEGSSPGVDFTEHFTGLILKSIWFACFFTELGHYRICHTRQVPGTGLSGLTDWDYLQRWPCHPAACRRICAQRPLPAMLRQAQHGQPLLVIKKERHVLFHQYQVKSTF